MLYKDDHKNWQQASKVQEGDRPPYAKEFKACLQQALKILEERYEV